MVKSYGQKAVKPPQPLKFRIFSVYLFRSFKTESPDFLRNQDFFRTFVPNNLLPIFSDPNADPNGTGSGKDYTAPERMLPIVFAASRLAEVVT